MSHSRTFTVNAAGTNYLTLTLQHQGWDVAETADLIWNVHKKFTENQECVCKLH